MSTAEFSSGFTEAMQLTTQTIDRRAARFRNLVIGVVVISSICLVWSAFQWTWRPLLGLLLLVPLCGIYFSLDTGIVNGWQEQILRLWIQEDLNLSIFSDSIKQIRILPHNVLKSMIDMLPTEANAVRTSKMSSGTRGALSLILQTISRFQHDRTTFLVLAYTIALGAIILALFYRSWLLLLGGLLILPVISISKLTISWRFNQLKKEIIGLTKTEDINLTHILEAALQIDWGCISDKKRDQLLNSLADGEASRVTH